MMFYRALSQATVAVLARWQWQCSYGGGGEEGDNLSFGAGYWDMEVPVYWILAQFFCAGLGVSMVQGAGALRKKHVPFLDTVHLTKYCRLGPDVQKKITCWCQKIVSNRSLVQATVTVFARWQFRCSCGGGEKGDEKF